MLIHAQQIDHGRHQHDASADAQEAYEHAADKPEQKNCDGHRIQDASRKGPRIPVPGPLFSTVQLATATSREHAVTLTTPTFFCLLGTCYICMSLSRQLWPAGSLLDRVGSQMTLDPRKH